MAAPDAPRPPLTQAERFKVALLELCREHDCTFRLLIDQDPSVITTTICIVPAFGRFRTVEEMELRA